MTTNKEKCVCCDQPFPSLSELLAHIKIHHTEAEVLEAITKQGIEQAESRIRSYV